MSFRCTTTSQLLFSLFPLFLAGSHLQSISLSPCPTWTYQRIQGIKACNSAPSEVVWRRKFARPFVVTILTPSALPSSWTCYRRSPKQKRWADLSWFQTSIHRCKNEVCMQPYPSHFFSRSPYFWSYSYFMLFPMFPSLHCHCGTAPNDIQSPAPLKQKYLKTKAKNTPLGAHETPCSSLAGQTSVSEQTSGAQNVLIVFLNEVIPLMLGIFISPTSREVQSRADQRRSNLMLRFFSMWR